MLTLFQLFNFAGQENQIGMLKRTAGFAAFFAVLWGVQKTGILAPTYARANELIIFGLVLAFVPILALMTRRFADTVFPGWLILAGPLSLGLAAASAKMFNFDLGETLFTYLGYALLAALFVGLLWPSRSHSSQPA